eukprot:10379519-Alexandrium_andersonii.AAC.1
MLLPLDRDVPTAPGNGLGATWPGRMAGAGPGPGCRGGVSPGRKGRLARHDRSREGGARLAR